jgi:hypothetical protein
LNFLLQAARNLLQWLSSNKTIVHVAKLVNTSLVVANVAFCDSRFTA